MNLSPLYKLTGQTAPPEARDADMEKLHRAAGKDWPQLLADPDQLAVFRAVLACTETRRAGRRPEYYTQASECKDCGWVWLWPGAPTRVLGCPWCFNRASGLPIPRPPIFNSTNSKEINNE
ncbi:MAG: hypothetical protein Q7J84_13915 [Sulfuricaulis sp.]|nr:hypothetical protein [Sulfuricaulis sp.]